MSFDRVIVMPVSRSSSIIVAQALGAGMKQRALTASRRGLGLVMLSSSSYVALLLAISRYFISVFTRDPFTFDAATRMLIIFGPSIVFFGVFMLSNSIARGSGHTLFMASAGLARLWLLRIPDLMTPSLSPRSGGHGSLDGYGYKQLSCRTLGYDLDPQGHMG